MPVFFAFRSDLVRFSSRKGWGLRGPQCNPGPSRPHAQLAVRSCAAVWGGGRVRRGLLSEPAAGLQGAAQRSPRPRNQVRTGNLLHFRAAFRRPRRCMTQEKNEGREFKPWKPSFQNNRLSTSGSGPLNEEELLNRAEIILLLTIDSLECF